MDEDRKFPIAFIGETFMYDATKLGSPFYPDCDIWDLRSGKAGLIYATVLAVSTNHFTGEYVYKVRRDYFLGGVEEDWCTEKEVQRLKGMVDSRG